jgi:hypothetical protein
MGGPLVHVGEGAEKPGIEMKEGQQKSDDGHYAIQRPFERTHGFEFVLNVLWL